MSVERLYEMAATLAGPGGTWDVNAGTHGRDYRVAVYVDGDTAAHVRERSLSDAIDAAIAALEERVALIESLEATEELTALRRKWRDNGNGKGVRNV